MALLQGSLRTLLSAGFRGADLMRTLNAHLYANIPSNRLITLFYCEFDPATGALRYVNGGHNAPFLLRAGGVERLPATGMALGVVAGRRLRGAGDRASPPASACSSSRTASPRPSTRRSRSTARSASRPSSWAMPPWARRSSSRACAEDVLAFCGAVRPRDDMTMMVVAS